MSSSSTEFQGTWKRKLKSHAYLSPYVWHREPPRRPSEHIHKPHDLTRQWEQCTYSSTQDTHTPPTKAHGGKSPELTIPPVPLHSPQNTAAVPCSLTEFQISPSSNLALRHRTPRKITALAWRAASRKTATLFVRGVGACAHAHVHVRACACARYVAF